MGWFYPYCWPIALNRHEETKGTQHAWAGCIFLLKAKEQKPGKPGLIEKQLQIFNFIFKHTCSPVYILYTDCYLSIYHDIVSYTQRNNWKKVACCSTLNIWGHWFETVMTFEKQILGISTSNPGKWISNNFEQLNSYEFDPANRKSINKWK